MAVPSLSILATPAMVTGADTVTFFIDVKNTYDYERKLYLKVYWDYYQNSSTPNMTIGDISRELTLAERRIEHVYAPKGTTAPGGTTMIYGNALLYVEAVNQYGSGWSLAYIFSMAAGGKKRVSSLTQQASALRSDYGWTH